MARYPLQDLLRVRKFREDNASSALTAQRKKVAEAEALVTLRKKEVADYHVWRLKKEEDLFAEIVRQQVHRHDLDDLNAKIEGLRAKEISLEEAVREAENGLKAAREALVKTQQAHQAAVRDREKISEHREQWMQEDARERENAAEKELEDFRVADRDDDAPTEDELSDDGDPDLLE